MRKTSWPVPLVALAVMAAAMAPGASADSLESRLERARAVRASALAAQREAEKGLAHILSEYQGAAAALSVSIRDIVLTYQAQRTLSDQLAQAQDLLDERASAAYQLGPGVSIELFLGARTLAEFASAQEYVAHTFQVDEETLDAVTRARASLAGVARRLEARRADLAASELYLRSLASEATDRLLAARAEAKRAGDRAEDLERELQELREAQAAVAAALGRLIDPTKGFDQSRLLALLGPRKGRGCDIPSGLRDTGQRVEGLSSWYGWEFAGRPTASGAIFDPRMFTAANKELPLNVFLRIHYKERCAIVLVNDRGPYGGGRVFDVAEAVADYLGYLRAGVVYVEADVLIPA
jgi:rare lipoprotein A (peptidoglycan hydrolase)